MTTATDRHSVIASGNGSIYFAQSNIVVADHGVVASAVSPSGAELDEHRPRISSIG